MKIRIKWENGQWWAYFNDHPESYFHSERLDWMCEVIKATWPKESSR